MPKAAAPCHCIFAAGSGEPPFQSVADPEKKASPVSWPFYRPTERLNKAVNDLDGGRPRTQARHSPDKVRWLGQPWCPRMRHHIGRIRRVQQDQQRHLMSGSPQLVCDFVSDNATNTVAAEHVGTLGLRRSDLV